MGVAPDSASNVRRVASAVTNSWSSIQSAAASVMARTSGVSMDGWTWISVTPTGQAAHRVVDPLAATRSPVVVEVIGEHDAFLRGQPAEGEPGLLGGDGGRQADGQAELARELEVHIEELGSQRDHREVRRQVRDIDAPRHRAFDLRPALAQHLRRVGVLPQIVDFAREAAFARQQ